MISVHEETVPHLHRTLTLIRSLGAQAGVALNPSTPVGTLEDVAADVDFVLIMSVNPGFGGQTFIPRSESKIREVRALLDEKRLGYEVTVFAMVHLSSQADADLKAFEDFVRAQPLVRECWMLSGEIDFVLKCVAPDLKTFQAFVAELTAAPHVRNVKTSLTLRNSKDAAMVPMDLPAPGGELPRAVGD